MSYDLASKLLLQNCNYKFYHLYLTGTGSKDTAVEFLHVVHIYLYLPYPITECRHIIIVHPFTKRIVLCDGKLYII